jgi:hypothetical protein
VQTGLRLTTRPPFALFTSTLFLITMATTTRCDSLPPFYSLSCCFLFCLLLHIRSFFALIFITLLSGRTNRCCSCCFYIVFRRDGDNKVRFPYTFLFALSYLPLSVCLLLQIRSFCGVFVYPRVVYPAATTMLRLLQQGALPFLLFLCSLLFLYVSFNCCSRIFFLHVFR